MDRGVVNMDVILVAELIVDLLIGLDLDFGYAGYTKAELVDEIADILEDNT
jgi:hypothetical protein